MELRVSPLLRGSTSAALATALTASLLLAVPPAHAGAKDRVAAARTHAASIAERVYDGRGVLPKKMNRKKLKRLYSYSLPKKFKVERYKRIDPTTFRICITHKQGGWATWHSGKGKLRTGRGDACRF